MSESDHQRIDELIAGHVLRALEGEDAAEAERVLAEHVPTCPRCRSILDELEETAGDLALAAGPAPPPELLLTRLHREIRERGESDALTAALARGYAHLALLTEFHWSPAPTAFKKP